MIQELEKKDFQKVEYLFGERSFINSFRSHLERTPVPKQVFVDDIKNPQTAVIIIIPSLFFGGRADNEEFNKELRKMLYEDLLLIFKEKQLLEIDCYVSNNAWEKAVKSVLKDPFLYNRYYYEIKELKLKHWRNLIPEGYSIKPVDLTLLENDYLKNFDWLIEEIEENWFPLEDGLKENRGFYLVREQEEIVCWCTTEYLTADNEIEVGIATREEYQRKGFASIIGSATAEFCLEKYKSVGSHFGITNVGSYKTAEKIGYEKIREYKKAAAFINQVDNWVANGFQKSRNKDYEESISWYEKIVDAANKETTEYLESYYLNGEFPIERVCFRISTFFSALGNIQKAVDYLRKAIEIGFKEKEELLECKLLEPLHGTEEWNKMIQLMRN
ncbi:MAG: GNAT family N-acetyltransferase [Candidatus Lokiarchaeota archaeon]|nr:GNAT family N-acetyltransferase [Candidatus Lokiarchaeota archaeon]